MTEVSDIIKAGKAALRDHVPNRELGAEQHAAWLKWLGENREDERAMEDWQGRGFVSGDPGDRPREAGDEYEAGGEYACEHGYSGRHFPPGAESPCPLLRPNVEDWFLTEHESPRGEAPHVYPYLPGPSGDDAELDSIAAVMEKEPFSREGGGTTGVEDAYHVARNRMSLPLPPVPDGVPSMRGEEDALDDA
jgi:hypothetical protein